MAHLLGLIFLALAWLAPVPARAGTPPTTQYQADWNGTLSALSATPEAACADAGQKRIDYSAQTYPENAPWTLYSTSYTAPTTCSAVYSNQFSGQVTATYSVATVQTCPDGQSLVNGECVPPVNLCAELAGKSAGNYNLLVPAGAASKTGPKQLCITTVSSGDSAQPGCLATGDSTFAFQHDGSTFISGLNPGWYAQVALAFTGAKCNPDPNGSTDASTTPPSPSPALGPATGQTSRCPVGKVPGEVNGQTICVNPGTDTQQEVKKKTDDTEQKADGTTVEKTTSKQTVCDATKCATTTTTTTKTTPPGGTASTTTEASTSTCVVGSPDCTAKAGVGGGGGGGGAGGDDASFGGSCTAAFSCKGDAVMCAVALEQHKRDCALFVDSSPESDLYASEKTKTGAQYSPENVTISNSSFNSSNAFGGSAQCIQDKAITVWGSQLVLPFSQVCDTLAHLGTLLMTVSFLLAFRIVARG